MSEEDPNELEELFERRIAKYSDALAPLFFYDEIIPNDITQYFAALLRTSGMEDAGWDPHSESRALLEDLNTVIREGGGGDLFSDFEKTQWRFGLLLYSHIIEMSAPLEVLRNLCSIKLKEGTRPNPFFKHLNSKEKKRARRNGIATWKKIEVLKEYSKYSKSTQNA